MGILKVIRVALRQHMAKHDPHVDDMPSARHAAREHRKDCPYCSAGLIIEEWHRKKDLEIVLRNNLCGAAKGGGRLCKSQKPCHKHNA